MSESSAVPQGGDSGTLNTGRGALGRKKLAQPEHSHLGVEHCLLMASPPHPPPPPATYGFPVVLQDILPLQLTPPCTPTNSFFLGEEKRYLIKIRRVFAVLRNVFPSAS